MPSLDSFKSKRTLTVGSKTFHTEKNFGDKDKAQGSMCAALLYADTAKPLLADPAFETVKNAYDPDSTEPVRPIGPPADAYWVDDPVMGREWVSGTTDANGHKQGLFRWYRADGTQCCENNYVDDQAEEDENYGKRPELLRYYFKSHVRALREGQLAWEEDPAGQVLLDLRARMLAASSEEWILRFARDVEDYLLRGTLRGAEHWTRGSVPRLDDYERQILDDMLQSLRKRRQAK